MNMRSNNGNFEKYKSEMLRMYQQQNRPMNQANAPQNSFSGSSNQRGYVQNPKNRNDNVLSNLNAQLSNMAGSPNPNETGLESSLQLDDDFPPASYRQDISSHTVRGDTPIEYNSQGMRTSDLIFDNSDQSAGSENARQVQAPENLSISPQNGSYFMQNSGNSQQNNMEMGNSAPNINRDYDLQRLSEDLPQNSRNNEQNVANFESIQTNNENQSEAADEQFQRDWNNFETRNTSNGFLKVQVYSARGAFPIKDAKITIFKEFDGQNKIFYEILTDESGITQPVSLPAPDASHSFAVDGIRPYENYSISVSKFGFEDATRNGLPIFPGVVSLQPIQLGPQLASQQDENPNLERNF